MKVPDFTDIRLVKRGEFFRSEDDVLGHEMLADTISSPCSTTACSSGFQITPLRFEVLGVEFALQIRRSLAKIMRPAVSSRPLWERAIRSRSLVGSSQTGCGASECGERSSALIEAKRHGSHRCADGNREVSGRFSQASKLQLCGTSRRIHDSPDPQVPS